MGDRWNTNAKFHSAFGDKPETSVKPCGPSLRRTGKQWETSVMRRRASAAYWESILRDEHVPRKANTEAETKSWRTHAAFSTKYEPHTVWAAHTDIMS